MANNSTSDWDVAAPANTDPLSDGAKEIRLVRGAAATRINKEHVTVAGSGAGGEHKAGSAVAYVATSNPTTRPNGDALTSADNGRLLVRTDQGNTVYFYSHPTWTLFIVGNVGTGAITATQLATNSVTAAKIADAALDDAAQMVSGFFAADTDLVTYPRVSKFANAFWDNSDVSRNKFAAGFLAANAVGQALMASGFITADHLSGLSFPRVRVTSYASATPTINVACGFDPDVVIIVPSGGGTIGMAFKNDTTFYLADAAKQANMVGWGLSGGVQITGNVGTRINSTSSFLVALQTGYAI